MKKNLLIKLRQMLLKFEDINTEEGVVLSVDGELEVGKEVFTTDDNGDVVPAPDGDYNYENKVITVSEGVVTVIADKEAPVETPAEEAPAEEEPVVEETTEEETPAEEPAPEETPAEDEKDAKIAELQARIAELEAENAELKAKLEEPADKPAEEEFKSQEADEPTAQEKAANIVKFLRNRK
jgi:hypothetical protein